MVRRVSKILSGFIGMALMIQSLGCGTIFYPERRGQTGGRIDAGVAVLDGIGLLFFIIPGVIAFAVDFGNGTIYLPGTAGARGFNDLEKVRFDPMGDSKRNIESIVRIKTGYPVKLEQEGLQVTELKSLDEARALLRAAASRQSARRKMRASRA